MSKYPKENTEAEGKPAVKHWFTTNVFFFVSVWWQCMQFAPIPFIFSLNVSKFDKKEFKFKKEK